MNNNNKLTIVAFTDDKVLIVVTENELRNTTNILNYEGKGLV